jgi:hypothetical protein
VKVKDSKCKIKVVKLSELEANMERMKQPHLEKDFAYYMKISLSVICTNLHILKASRDVAKKNLMETFNKALPRLRFWYT